MLLPALGTRLPGRFEKTSAPPSNLEQPQRSARQPSFCGFEGIVTVWRNGVGGIRSEINREITRTLSDQMNEALEKSADPFRQRNKKSKSAK